MELSNYTTSKPNIRNTVLLSIVVMEEKTIYILKNSSLGMEPTASTLETENGYSLFNATEK